jgi:hypothetical protein
MVASVTTYAYLHGFGSSPSAKKAVALRAAFAERGLALSTPDLAVPSFGELTLSAALEVVAELGTAARARGEKLALIGSSMGGFLAALHAARAPDDIEALVLLCPGFDMAARFRRLVGEHGMTRWRTKNRIAYPDGDSKLTAIHYGLYEDALRHPAFPPAPEGVPVTIVHGRRDTVVPIDVSRAYVATYPRVKLLEIDDDHSLHASIPEVFTIVRDAFDLPSNELR